MTFRLAGLVVAMCLFACGPKGRPMVDAGPGDEDAGVDAGVIDAGRVKGDEPPSNWSIALRLPEDAGVTSRYGVSTSMALDQFSHPMVAALIVDPNADSVNTDTRLVFTRWNGVQKKWQDPVTVEVVGDIDVAHPKRQVSLTRDASTGRIGVAYVNGDGFVRYGYSDDEGDHFSLETVSATRADGAKLSNPVLGLKNGETHVAYVAHPTCTQGCGELVYRKRTGTGAFVDQSPAVTAVGVPEYPIAMALNAAGVASVAFFTDEAAGSNTALKVWNTGTGTVPTVASSTLAIDAPAKIPSVSMIFDADLAKLAFHYLQPASADGQVFYAKATDTTGATFSTPAELPRNGPAGMLDGTQWYQAIVADGAGKTAVAANYARTLANPNVLMCGGPKLGRTTDGTTWSSPGMANSVCHPLESGGVIAHTFNQAGLWLNLAAHKPGKLTLALDYEARGNLTLGGAGVVVYREP